MIRYVATNLTDLHKEPSFISELLTQVTNGVALDVLKEHDAQWCYVRQMDGYEGWAYTPFLTTSAPPVATHLLRAPMLGLWPTRDDSAPSFTRFLAGTRVRVVEQKESWYRIQPAGERWQPGWVPVSPSQTEAFLRPLAQLPLPASAAREQMIADAQQFRGVYYLWGGCTAWGIDCSGLAQLCHRLSGYEIPRDCMLQFPVGRPIEPPFQAGDLLYFWNEARTKVGHVGISLGDGWKIIHSSRRNNGVYEEDVEQNPNLKASYAGARSFLPTA